MLYKFIVWAFWAKIQPYIRSTPSSVLAIGAVCEKNLIYSKGGSSVTKRQKNQVYTKQRWVHTRWVLIYTKKNQGVLSIAIRVGALNVEEAVREVCTQLIPAKVNLKGRAMFPM